ncbi:MAG TPA: asparagine synthase-related protein, partial [Solirubrobacteraceae bacterium]|nr:asparagine synthase-related protein [Solirubrobacteraceae bacterium]
MTLAAWTTGYAFFPEERALLAGLLRVPRGHAARLRAGARPQLVRYWDPRGERLRPSPEHGPRLRATLIETLERELDEDGRNLLTLSGGVDSSCLAALAAGTAGRSIATLTMITTAAEARNELIHVDRLDRLYGFRRRHVVAFDTAVRMEMLRQAPPSLAPVVHPALCVLPDVAGRAPVRVLLGGEVADHICGAELAFPDWVAEHPPRKVVPHLRAMPFGRAGLKIYGRQRAAARARRPPVPFPREVAGAIRAELREDYEAWWHERRRSAAADRRPHRWVALMLEADGYIEMNWEVASRLGIR